MSSKRRAELAATAGTLGVVGFFGIMLYNPLMALAFIGAAGIVAVWLGLYAMFLYGPLEGHYNKPPSPDVPWKNP